ncbi:MAG TPA: STAS-like domain-containing protein [Pyrinomonadaceae bacterium]|nr:STAS-like domain-containing protein [Pyrinomonadaceae bacterium]
MKINVRELIGENCVSYDDGKRIYDLIHPELQSGKLVNLDFSGVRVLVSLFLNAAIGHLLEDVSTENLNQLLVVSNLPQGGLETLRRVIENSRDYYFNPHVREALDRILTERSVEI